MLPAIELKQENVVMYLTKMKIGQLEECSKVMHYDSLGDKDYQRPPLPAHYRKIAKYFMTEKNPILPSAIIAAMGSNDFTYEEGKLTIINPIRIVDGQHRIEGIKCLRDGYCKSSKERYEIINREFDLPVIIMVIDEENAMTEIDAFINLNSKGKKVKTDLAEALKIRKYQHEVAQDDVLQVTEELKDAISMNIVRAINIMPDSMWKGLIIQADEIGNRKEQPISVLAFSRSVRPLVSCYFRINQLTTISGEDKEKIEVQLTKDVIKAWDIVMKRWPKCFDKNVMYNKSFNICKGIGVTALYEAFSECYDGTGSGFEIFEKKLNDSKVEYKDWLVGGTFTGYASAQGFSMIKQFICGEIDRERFW